MHRLSKALKRFAPRAMAHAVAPGLAARRPHDDAAQRPGVGRVGLRHGLAVHPRRCGRPSVAGLACGPLRRRPWGLAGAVAFSRPAADRHRSARPFRPARPRHPPRAAGSPPPPPSGWPACAGAPGEHAGSGDGRRAARPLPRAPGGGHRRACSSRAAPTCPACGGADLSVRVRTGDLLQGKPGTVHARAVRRLRARVPEPPADRRGPRLLLRRLLRRRRRGGDGAARCHRLGPVQRRAPTSWPRHAEPRRWLDVGGGHGHFSLVARGVWPKAALRRGRPGRERRGGGAPAGGSTTAHRGHVPRARAAVAGEYDVVSMHHYLEHTRDPGRRARRGRGGARARRACCRSRCPTPTRRWPGSMGRWWGPYLQPQHLNMVTRCPTSSAMLAERGFTVIDRHGAEAHQACDFGFAAYMVANRLGPPVDVPWRPAPTRWSQLRRSVGFSAGMPLIGARPARRQPDEPVRARAAGVERLPGAGPARPGALSLAGPVGSEVTVAGLEVLGSPVPPRHDDHSTRRERPDARIVDGRVEKPGLVRRGRWRPFGGAPSRPRRGGTPRRSPRQRTRCGRAPATPTRRP